MRCWAGWSPSLGIDVHTVVVGTRRRSSRPAARTRCGCTLVDGTADRRRRGGLRRRRAAARRTGPARPAWRSPNAAACSPTHLVPQRDPNIYAIGEVAAIEGRCYGLVGPGYTTAEVVADRLLGGAAEFPGRGPVDQAQAARRRRRQLRRRHGRHPGLPRGRRQRRRQPDVRQAGALRRRQDAARRRPGRRRVGLRRAAADGRRTAARRPARADRACRIRRRRGGISVSARCPPARRSAPATTSPRAISPAPSPTAAATCPR